MSLTYKSPQSKSRDFSKEIHIADNQNFRLIALIAILFTFILGTSAQAQDWEKLYDTSQNEIEVRILKVGANSVTVRRRKDQKEFQIPFKRLAEDSVELVKEWKSNQGEGGQQSAGAHLDDIPIDLPGRLYPRSLVEIQEGLAEIRNREGGKGFAKDQVDGVNLLNAYRFLSGVSSDVELCSQKIEEAIDAANACQKHGSLSHDIGHFTDKCNLHRGQSSIASSVSGYIEDPGANNRNERGHRMWCFNPPMEEVGFGVSENKGFFAMWCMDGGGKSARDFWAYPGEGLYPLSYLHGNSWSCYLTEKAPAAEDLKVEVYLLSERPDKPFSSSDEIPGKALPVPFVYTYRNNINFEPTGKKIRETGIYYVRISGGGIREGYLVELIDL